MEAKLVAEKSAKIRDWVSHKVQEVIVIIFIILSYSLASRQTADLECYGGQHSC